MKPTSATGATTEDNDMNPELEAMVLRRTGKSLGELKKHEFEALIEELENEGKAHQAHSDELNDFLERRSAPK